MKPGGGLVRTWAVRGAMHTIPSEDYYVYMFGGASERMLKWIDTIAKKRNYPSREERRKLFYDPILDEMKGGAVGQDQFRELVSVRARRLGLREGVWSGVGEMAFLGLLVWAGKRGSTNLWMRSDEWVSKPKKLPDRQTCRVELLRKYIARHGPVSRNDITYWSYLSRGHVDQALSDLGSDLVEVRIGHSKEAYIALDQDFEQDLPPPPKVIVLPKYDSLLLSLRDKSRFMDMAYYKRIFPKIPVAMVKPTVLLDGFVAAAWRRVAKKRATSIEVQPFRKISRTDKKAVEQHFLEYCNYAGVEAPLRWVRGP